MTGVNIAGNFEWEPDTNRMVNHLILQASNQAFTKTDNFTGDGATKTYTLTYKPESNIRVVIDGQEQKPTVTGAMSGDYTVDKENKQVIFNTPPSNNASIEISYTYNVPIRIEAKSSESIEKYGEVTKKIKKNSIKTFSDARSYIKKYLSLYSEPILTGKATLIKPEAISVGKQVHITDTKNNIDRDMIVKKMIYHYPSNQTEVWIGSQEYLIWDWYSEVIERIKQLEEGQGSNETIQKYNAITENIDTNIAQYKITIKKRDRAGMICLDLDYPEGVLDNPNLKLDYYPDNNTGWETIYEA